MHKTSRIFGIICTLSILSLATEHSLMAYADPGSGAMFVQIILAGLLGLLYRLRSVFSRFRRRKDDRVPADQVLLR